MKHFCIIPFEGSSGKQLIGLSEFPTLMMKFVIIGKTMTSNEKTVFRECFVVLCEDVENNLIVSELECGLENNCSRKEHSEHLTNMTMKLEFLERQRRWMTNSKDQ